MNDGSKTLLAASDDSYYFFAWPVWSPDGKWISYINVPSGITSTFEDSLYMTATGCLEKPQTCPGEMKGPVSRPKYAFRGPMAWSPDSSFLAVFDGTHVVKNILQVVNIRGNSRRTLMDDLSASGMVWLSGGQIVFDQDEHIVKVDPGQDDMTVLANLDGVVIGAVLIGQ
ncbi:MAG: hypothetical protein AB1894_04885 [Chloroflexota bacterium]